MLNNISKMFLIAEFLKFIITLNLGKDILGFKMQFMLNKKEYSQSLQ
jgi:hypothetical protein